MKDFSKEIRACALKNAVDHGGMAVAGNVLTPLFNFGLKKEQIKDVMPKINEIVKEVNLLGLEEQKSELDKVKDILFEKETRKEDELPELPNVDKKKGVIMRFSPSASGIMHLGHILTGMPSSLYVKKYGGKFYLRVEDTNPEKVDSEAYKSLPKDSDWVFGNVTEWYAQSDRIKKYYDFAEKLIKKGAAFVCTCKNEPEESEIKIPRKACACRNNQIKDNTEMWKKMLDKKGFREGEAVLRFKSEDVNANNPALIDFPLARIVESPHPRQGKKYRVWPLMNLCVALDDMEFGLTHIIRGKEHADNALRQAMIFKVFKKKFPETFFLGKYRFEDLPLSKTKIKEMINNGDFSGWDDVRLPLARNFRRRGYQPKTFEILATKRGLSNVDKVMTKADFFQLLDDINRKILHEIAIKASFDMQERKEKGSVSILMDDATIIYGSTNLNMKKIKDTQIVHFVGFGYCRYNKSEKIPFWFAHR